MAARAEDETAIQTIYDAVAVVESAIERAKATITIGAETVGSSVSACCRRAESADQIGQ